MIDKIEVSGNNYKIGETLQKYAEKRIGKLDRYLPRNNKKDVIAKIIFTEVNRDHGNKYEVSATLEIPGGKVIVAKDECSNVFAGVDLIEEKLMGQIRRFKLESTPHLRRKSLKNLFNRQK